MFLLTDACLYLYEICISLVTVHLTKARTRSYAPCSSGEKKPPARHPFHHRLRGRFVFCTIRICAQRAVEEKSCEQISHFCLLERAEGSICNGGLILTCKSGEGNDPFSSPLCWQVREEKGRHLSLTKKNFATRQLMAAVSAIGGIHAIRLVNLPHPCTCLAVVY